jgi:nickel superoxide dismutase
MQRATALSIFLTLTFAVNFALPHCQVPCGIYGDQRRFEEMLEDTETIAKAMAQIADLSGKDDALSHNQLARWVVTKEQHAANIQSIIAQYFMAQRIKADAEQYTKQLTTAHGVIVAAMKSKQNIDPAVAESLKKAILDFYRAYEGKEPVLDK